MDYIPTSQHVCCQTQFAAVELRILLRFFRLRRGRSCLSYLQFDFVELQLISSLLFVYFCLVYLPDAC